MILVSGATKTFRRFAGHPAFGHLKTPRNGNCVPAILASNCPWAADNDAFSGFDETAYRRMLRQIADAPRLLWVTVPDVVADARRTLELFERWQPELAAMGLPMAFVGQDGAESMELPWERFDCLFVGGSTKWKLSAEAEQLGREANARGKWLHMGRVNTRKRMRHAIEVGCDSVDGTAFSRWPDKYFPTALRWIRELESTRSMF